MYLSLVLSGEWHASVDYHGHLPNDAQVKMVVGQLLEMGLIDNRTWGLTRRSSFCAQIGSGRMLQESAERVFSM